MDAETWLTAQECLKYGFATEIADEDEDENEIQQSAFSIIREAVITRNQSKSTLEEKVEALYQKLCIEPPKTPKEPEPKNSIDFLATLFNNLI
jgi:enoyl-CoA hydratase/carnithine racemase